MKLRQQGRLLALVLGVDVVLGLTLAETIGRRAERNALLQVSSGQDHVEPKVVALTFDDGPNADYTERLLDGLRERDVRASFFLLGKCLAGNETLVKQMEQDGHLIGVHGMQHTDLTRQPAKETLKQLKDTRAAIASITGKQPDYVRPPYGSWNETLEEAVWTELDMVSVFWSVDSIDWKLQNPSQIVQQVMKEVEDGDIILMHDEFAASVEAALQIVDRLLAEGYGFVTVDELMID